MRIRLLGGFSVESDRGTPVRFSTRKSGLLLAALALAGEKGLRRDFLSTTFWPDRGEAQARGSLRQSLADLRRAFPDGVDGSISVRSDLESIALAAQPADIDVRLFETLIRKKDLQSLASAADLYQGDALAGVALPDEAEQWFAPHRRSCRRAALKLAEDLSLIAAAAEHMAACERLGERLLASDPAAEEAHRALIRLRQRQGRINAAARQFELCKEALRRELGAEPEEETVALMALRPQPGGGTPQVENGTPAQAAGAPEQDQPSVVVMPFDNLSSASDEPFADGVVEEITATLSRVRDFFVIARQSAFAYRGRSVDVREIGRELGVRYVVEGTVRRATDRVRITVQLVDARTRAQLWSERYEGATTDIFEFQDRIAMQVAGAIHPAVLNAEIRAAMRKPPGSLRAYESVLQAYPKIWSATAEENRQAITLLTDALAADPKYARAHALLAWCYSQEVVYLWSADPERDRQLARRAVDAASGLTGDDPMAMTAIGAALSQCLGEHDRAGAIIEAALALDPNNAWAWARYGWVALYRDEPEPAKHRFERAQTLSPLDPLAFNFKIGIAIAVGFAGDYATAARLMQEVLNKHPNVTWAYRQLAAFAALAGDLASARAAMKTLLAAHPNASVALMNTHHPGRHQARTFNLQLEGWRLAGLPER